jgi:hypothetical protein
MKKIIRLTESDLVRLVKRVINESDDKLNPPGFKFAAEKIIDNVKFEIYVQDHRGFKIGLFISPKQRIKSDEFYIVRVVLSLPGGETIDMGQTTHGVTFFKVERFEDGKLQKLIHDAKNMGEFRRSYDNSPRMR